MAIYPSINLSPQSKAVDTSINQNFTFIVAGSPITDYQIKIWDMGIIPNTLVHTSAKVALSPNKTNGDTVTHSLTGGTIVVNKKYKWQVETWSGATSAVSRQVVFESYTTPTISLTITSPVTTQSLTLTGVYAQAQSIPINSFTFELYNSSYSLIESSGLIYGFNATHTFTGLESGKAYSARLYGLNQVGMPFDTGFKIFSVSYTKVDLNVYPEATVDDDTGNVNVNWNRAVQINGAVTGSISYGASLNSQVGYALNVPLSSSVDWTFAIDYDFSSTFTIQIPSTTSGYLVELKNGYKFGFESNKFFVEKMGYKNYSITYDPTGKKYMVLLRPLDFIIREYTV